MINRSFAVLLTVFSILADDPSKKAGLIPLSVGNYWLIEQKTYEDDDNTAKIDTLKLSITASVNDPSEKLFYYTWEEINWISDLVANKPDGLYLFGQASLTNINLYTSPYLWLKYPCDIGEKFYDPQNGIEYTVTDKLNIEVPAGSFDCIEYSSKNKINNTEMKLYFSPGIGYIKGIWPTKKMEQSLIKAVIIDENNNQ